jgi:hypothetical protein
VRDICKVLKIYLQPLGISSKFRFERTFQAMDLRCYGRDIKGGLWVSPQVAQLLFFADPFAELPEYQPYPGPETPQSHLQSTVCRE